MINKHGYRVLFVAVAAFVVGVAACSSPACPGGCLCYATPETCPALCDKLVVHGKFLCANSNTPDDAGAE